MTPAELEALGLYDPNAPDAPARLAMLELAIEHGATEAEMRSALEERRLHLLAVERITIEDSSRLTLAEVAERAGVEIEFAEKIWRALGFAAAGDASVCSERDVDLLRFHLGTRAVFGEDQALAMARTAGGGLARNADAIIAVIRSGLEAPLRAGGSGDDVFAHELVGVAQEFLPLLYPMFETVHRRHLVQTMRRYVLWDVPPNDASRASAVIGFADIVGSTELANRLPQAEVDAMLQNFEIRALEITTGVTSRLVKMIGDEVLFIAADANEAAGIATALHEEPGLPPLRVGMAAGDVIARDGDVYGPVVNLAARLVALAEPGQVVMDAETARRLGGTGVVALGARVVRGFDEPIDVFALES